MPQKFLHANGPLLIEQAREFQCLHDHEDKDFKVF